MVTTNTDRWKNWVIGVLAALLVVCGLGWAFTHDAGTAAEQRHGAQVMQAEQRGADGCVADIQRGQMLASGVTKPSAVHGNACTDIGYDNAREKAALEAQVLDLRDDLAAQQELNRVLQERITHDERVSDVLLELVRNGGGNNGEPLALCNATADQIRPGGDGVDELAILIAGQC
jgi:hypothetical protein